MFAPNTAKFTVLLVSHNASHTVLFAQCFELLVKLGTMLDLDLYLLSDKQSGQSSWVWSHHGRTAWDFWMVFIVWGIQLYIQLTKFWYSLPGMCCIIHYLSFFSCCIILSLFFLLSPAITSFLFRNFTLSRPHPSSGSACCNNSEINIMCHEAGKPSRHPGGIFLKSRVSARKTLGV